VVVEEGEDDREEERRCPRRKWTWKRGKMKNESRMEGKSSSCMGLEECEALLHLGRKSTAARWRKKKEERGQGIVTWKKVNR